MYSYFVYVTAAAELYYCLYIHSVQPKTISLPAVTAFFQLLPSFASWQSVAFVPIIPRTYERESIIRRLQTWDICYQSDLNA